VNRFPHQVGGAVGALSELTASSRSLSRRTHRCSSPASDMSDFVTENSGQGTDTIPSSVT